MLTLLLTIVLTSQTVPTVEQVDLYFSAQQEQFAYEVSRDKQPPRHIKELFIELGCTEWSVRDEASKKLYTLCKTKRSEERWIFWGRHSRDLEVAYRCDKIIARLHPCDSCNGNGESKYSTYGECWQCKGIGTLWGLHPWN